MNAFLQQFAEMPLLAPAINTAHVLDIAGTRQAVRLSASRPGLPPVLVVQAGPGFPLLHEIPRYKQSLALESACTVAYWDQRGCGNAALNDIAQLSMQTQLEDLAAVVAWLTLRTGQKPVLLGISLGATLSLQFASRQPQAVRGVVAVSIDTDTRASDEAAMVFLRNAALQSPALGLQRSLARLSAPPYLDPVQFQLRARLLSGLGGIERSRSYTSMMLGAAYGLLRTYGMRGVFEALRNMNAIQQRLLPQLAQLDLLSAWPRTTVPVHYLFGADDPLIPQTLVQRVEAAAVSRDTVQTLPKAGHMLHFDQPAAVRAAVLRACNGG